MAKRLYLDNIVIELSAITTPEIMLELVVKQSLNTGAIVEILYDKEGINRLVNMLNKEYKQLTFSTGNLHYKSTIKLPVSKNDKVQILNVIKELLGGVVCVPNSTNLSE